MLHGRRHVLAPVEAYPQGKYDKQNDVLVALVFNRLLVLALCLRDTFWHFGQPCESFSMLNVNLNKGTRSRDNPYGDGSLKREVLGNLQANLTRRLIHALTRGNRNNKWSIENPATSYFWALPWVKRLIHARGHYLIRLHQCQYGLCFPDSPHNHFCKKDTYILTNDPRLLSLGKLCSGGHVHHHAVGALKLHGKWVSRTKLAGAYPKKLCDEWACKLRH